MIINTFRSLAVKGGHPHRLLNYIGKETEDGEWKFSRSIQCNHFNSQSTKRLPTFLQYDLKHLMYFFAEQSKNTKTVLVYLLTQ